MIETDALTEAARRVQAEWDSDLRPLAQAAAMDPHFCRVIEDLGRSWAYSKRLGRRARWGP